MIGIQKIQIKHTCRDNQLYQQYKTSRVLIIKHKVTSKKIAPRKRGRMNGNLATNTVDFGKWTKIECKRHTFGQGHKSNKPNQSNAIYSIITLDNRHIMCSSSQFNSGKAKFLVDTLADLNIIKIDLLKYDILVNTEKVL